MPVEFEPSEIASVLPREGRVLVLGTSGESLLLAEAISKAGPALGNLTFTGIFLPGLNRATYLPHPGCRNETFFMTPELAKAGSGVEFLPLCYEDILRRLSSIDIAAAIMMLAPPDSARICSFGTAIDFLAALWPRIPLRIAHINPLVPATAGHPGIPFDSLTAWCEAPAPLLTGADPPADPATRAIAGHIAGIIPNGATLQMGIGKVPGAVLGALAAHRDLKIFSGLISEAVLDLKNAGAVTEVTTGVAVGSAEFYAALPGSGIEFRPVSITHGLASLAAQEQLIAINSALQVDLFGQAYSEYGPGGFTSGPGGASDFARGVRAAGGQRIIALPATASKGRISRIVPPGGGMGPVSLGRTDLDIVCTEHGLADLRGLSYDARAEALIAIAAPEHRDHLAGSWQAFRRTPPRP